MLESVKVTNFQSLQNLEMQFGKFTVIVGASSSGKSAITRAIKAVTSNALHSDFITRGTKNSSVSLKVDETTITIERESGDSSVYKMAQAGSKESRYARLNRQVPAQVTEALGILPSTQEVTSINFAGQFDTPYLLKEGSSSVARVLGELTNVSVIFDAVKEANRRAKNASSLLNLRKKDEAELLKDITRFTDIGKVAKSVTSAEQLMVEAVELKTKIDHLNTLLAAAEQAEKVLENLVEIPTLPDLASVLQLQKTFNTCKNIIKSIASSKAAINTATSAIVDAETSVQNCEKQLHDLLIQAGTCPTCNQEIH